MKNVHKLTLVLAAIAFAATAHAQTTTTGLFTSSGPSTRDNPGTLGHSFLDLNYNWVDFTENQVDADAYIAGLEGNVPLTPGLDATLGYSYYRENGNGNIFTARPFDVRAHQLTGGLTLFSQNAGIKPFASAGIGYQWSRGDIQNLRIDDGDWLWGASVGAEIPLGNFALTPRISYANTFGGGDEEGQWSYGGEAHHWFTERLGGYVDATFHNPRGSFGADYWTYTAGLRFRF